MKRPGGDPCERRDFISSRLPTSAESLKNENQRSTLTPAGGQFSLAAKRESMSREHFLDFIQGLAAKVRRLEQFIFGALDKITDKVDAFSLEAIGGTNSKFGDHQPDEAGSDRAAAGCWLRLQA